jgi:DNA-binding NarL/FixJ family response regulator
MPRPQILCIEDDPDTAELIVEVLDEEGFRVTVAENGADGLSAIGERPDLVLCDIDMPGLSGFEVLQRIRQDKLLPRAVPFIFITAFSQRSYHMQARQLGCDDFIAKPIDFELLVAIIRNRLEHQSGDTPERPDFHLTDREIEALTWVARGKSSADIGVILGVSERTVNFHIDNVIRKTGVATRVQAAIKCVMLGLIRQ